MEKSKAWFYGSIVLVLKEFVAVVFQLVCYSRLRSFDLFTGPLVLYLTLVVFSFPFLNPYLFAVLRLGPWNTGENLGYVLIQTFCVAAAQCGGGAVAAVISTNVNSTWPSSGLVKSGSVVNGTGVAAGSMYNDSLENNWLGLVVLEEFAAVLALLVGVIHLVECHAESLLKKRPAPPPSTIDVITPLPSELVFQVCVLVAGIVCAFPSAHQALHVSIYLEVSGAEKAERVWLRFLGGFLATCSGILYYYVVYVWSVAEEGSSAFEGSSRAIMHNFRDPAYFYSRLVVPTRTKSLFI